MTLLIYILQNYNASLCLNDILHIKILLFPPIFVEIVIFHLLSNLRVPFLSTFKLVERGSSLFFMNFIGMPDVVQEIRVAA